MTCTMQLTSRTWWWTLFAIVLVAAVLRVWNLGTFSLWLDEVFTMTAADQPLAATLATCAQDAENVPLYAVIANLGLKLGGDETTLRATPIAAGLVSIVLLAVWTRPHFGPQLALLAAGFAALSPFHIRYSQELRAYPYLLVVSLLTLLAADRLRRRPDRWSTLALAATVAVGLYTHLTYLLVLVPAMGLLRLPRDEAPQLPARVWSRFALAVGLGLVVFVPWLWIISHNLVERMSRPQTTAWDLVQLGSRWHVLTVGAWERDQLGAAAIVVAAIALLGLAVVLRRPVGRLVFLPMVATLVAWELLLLVLHHWSSSRYATAVWPLLAVLIAVGFHRVLITLRTRPLQILVTAGMAAVLVAHVGRYYEIGRPHWDALAMAVNDARLEGELVVANAHWASLCTAYYLDQRVPTVDGRPDRLAAYLARSPSVLLVSRTLAPPADLLAVASTVTELAFISQTARLYRLERPAEPARCKPLRRSGTTL